MYHFFIRFTFTLLLYIYYKINNLKFIYIGLILEQGPEHNNKNVRFNREHHATKKSLQANLLDTFRRSTHTSDPDILEILEESLPKKIPQPISLEVLKLLLSNDSDSDSSSDSDSDSDDSDDSDV